MKPFLLRLAISHGIAKTAAGHSSILSEGRRSRPIRESRERRFQKEIADLHSPEFSPTAYALGWILSLLCGADFRGRAYLAPRAVPARPLSRPLETRELTEVRWGPNITAGQGRTLS